MRPRTSALGDVFGRLTVIEDDGARKVTCRCECGVVKAIDVFSLRAGGSTSCGCARPNLCRVAKLRHGHTKLKGPSRTSLTYNSWMGMVQRCTNPNNRKFPIYGGRGITVDPRWLGRGGFANFLADMGPRPSPRHSIDRFPDNDGPYTKDNCRWATAVQQANNRRPARRRLAPLSEIDTAAVDRLLEAAG